MAYARAAGFICALNLLFAVAGFFWQATIPLTATWLAVGIFTPLFVLFECLVSRRKLRLELVGNGLAWLLVGIYTLTTLVLLWGAGRRYAIVIALAETIIIYNLLGRKTHAALRISTIGLAVLGTWALTLGFPYTHLADWLLNATGSSGLAIIVFFAAFGLTLYISVTRSNGKMRSPVILTILVFAIAACAFMYLGMRTDNETALWMPYHQSYFTSPASLIRAHHWLLWDVPSQYGFLSILTLSALPTRTTFDAIHLLTAAVLFIQAMIVYTVFWLRRRDWANFVFALVLCCATFYSSQAQYYPFGARLYPQEGLRFLWPIVALLFAFCRYNCRAANLKATFMAAGYAAWILGVLWSFETGVWTTVIWGGYLFAEVIQRWLETQDLRQTLRAFGYRFGGLAALLLVAAGAVEFVYRLHFGHGPDWQAYIEFSAIYSNGSQAASVPPVDTFGAGWTIMLLLAALTAIVIIALRRRLFALLPLLSACWLAIWATSSYYAGEPFNQHVAMLAEVIIFVGAIVFWITESELSAGFTPLLARLSFLPVSVLLIAYAFGRPSYIHDIRGPFMNGYHADFSAGLPTINGELLVLERKAGIGPRDKVIYPNWAIWNKLSTGEILPLERNGDGTVTERIAWLPISPSGAYNAWLTLPPDRRSVYINRYLDESLDPGGWYITYRQPAVCADLSPRFLAIKRASTPNYNASLCRMDWAH